MSQVPPANPFVALDACHQQIQWHLQQLASLEALVAAGLRGPQVQAQAAEIEAFFSGASRKHHSDEEEDVFPILLASGDRELVATVRKLVEDHFWIEKHWTALATVMLEISRGAQCPDLPGFERQVRQFRELCNFHIALEESLVYPQAKERAAQRACST
jgi:hemerythrin-like domain-containing protein